jgi:hypothetical protein
MDDAGCALAGRFGGEAVNVYRATHLSARGENATLPSSTAGWQSRFSAKKAEKTALSAFRGGDFATLPHGRSVVPLRERPWENVYLVRKEEGCPVSSLGSSPPARFRCANVCAEPRYSRVALTAKNPIPVPAITPDHTISRCSEWKKLPFQPFSLTSAQGGD